MKLTDETRRTMSILFIYAFGLRIALKSQALNLLSTTNKGLQILYRHHFLATMTRSMRRWEPLVFWILRPCIMDQVAR